MELLISILLSTRLLTFFTGSIPVNQAYFSEPRIYLTSTEVRMTCVLNNAWPEELKKLIETGTPIVQYLFVELKDKKTGATVKKTFQESTLTYDLIGKYYCVRKNNDPDTICFAALDTAAMRSNMFSGLKIFSLENIQEDRNYFITIYAVLGKTRVEALNNKTIDLMYYWDYKRPSIRTEVFTGKQILIMKNR
jgi:hypothetical protein